MTLHFRTVGRGTEWLTRVRDGREARHARPARAPVRGRSAQPPPAARSPGGLGMAGLRMLADEAVRDGRQVTILFGAASASHVYPSSLLPDEVEYVVATDDGSLGHHGFVTELLPEYEAWADQAFACGPYPMLARLAAARRRAPRAAGRGQARPEAGRRQGGSARLHRRLGARPSCRSRWSRRWAARWARASADRGRRRRPAARLPRGPGLRRGRDRVAESA